MVEETQVRDFGNRMNKRKSGHKKGSNKARKKQKQFPGMGERVKIDPRVKKFLRKKARDYNSDDEDTEEGLAKGVEDDNLLPEYVIAEDVGGEEAEELGNEEDSDEEGEGTLPGITKLGEGSRAFRNAFKSVIKKGASEDPLGPVLSGHKKLVAEKLAEEEVERKAKGDAKKEKKLVAEKGHVKPANFLDTHERFLISVATKGVVKLFNAVNKAQVAQKGLNPLRSKDAKVINKRKKDAFYGELRRAPSASSTVKVNTSEGDAEGGTPSWAPLRDNYMLTNPKMKDWDKKLDSGVEDDIGGMSDDSSSDED
ncbi:unnamed protein product [Linum tenue]|uniref:RRP15-like protein n=1 Tax=Linum tenue TaxID=586396 RepID=A0AAV0RTK7_9ROSI|nr:unnamed protein product [Linum tenue]CAI0559548.1 unnamed protein product [Linum tenue]